MGEIVITLLPFVIEGLKIALENAIKEGIKYVVRKVINEAGKTVIRFITEGTEEVIYELDASIAQLSGVWNDMGLTLGNIGDEVGFGVPIYNFVSHNDFISFLTVPTAAAADGDVLTLSPISYLGSTAIVDYDGDGQSEPMFPVPDFDGDGYADWGELVDDDDNGLPDLSPDLPFYPVGSDEFTYIVEQQQKSQDKRPIMETPLDSYSVTEGLLLLALLFSVLNFVRGLFTRKDVFR